MQFDLEARSRGAGAIGRRSADLSLVYAQMGTNPGSDSIAVRTVALSPNAIQNGVGRRRFSIVDDLSPIWLAQTFEHQEVAASFVHLPRLQAS